MFYGTYRKAVLKIGTICHDRDLWKLTVSGKQLGLLCPPNLCNLPGTGNQVSKTVLGKCTVQGKCGLVGIKDLQTSEMTVKLKLTYTSDL